MVLSVFGLLVGHASQSIYLVSVHVEPVVGATLFHELESYELRSVLVEDEGILEERLDDGEVSTDQVAVAIRRDYAPAALWQGERVLNNNTLADIVEDLEAMDELAGLLSVVNSWQDIRLEPVFDPKISLEMGVEELIKLVLKSLCGPTFCEREVFIVRKLAEVFAKNILEIIQHLRHGRDPVRIYDLLLLLGFLLRLLPFFLTIFLLFLSCLFVSLFLFFNG